MKSGIQDYGGWYLSSWWDCSKSAEDDLSALSPLSVDGERRERLETGEPGSRVSHYDAGGDMKRGGAVERTGAELESLQTVHPTPASSEQEAILLDKLVSGRWAVPHSSSPMVQTLTGVGREEQTEEHSCCQHTGHLCHPKQEEHGINEQNFMWL